MGIVNRIKQSLPSFNFSQFTDSFSNKASALYKKAVFHFPSSFTGTKYWYEKRYVCVGLGFLSLSLFVAGRFLIGREISLEKAVGNADLFSAYVKRRISTAPPDAVVKRESDRPTREKMKHSIMYIKDSERVLFRVKVKLPNIPNYAIGTLFCLCKNNESESWGIDVSGSIKEYLNTQAPFLHKKLHEDEEVQQLVISLFKGKEYRTRSQISIALAGVS